MASAETYTGQCFCGQVELTATGAPVAMGYCHCSSCREWSAGPVNAFTLWAPDAVRITRGADQVGKYQKTEKSVRVWCTNCGGHLIGEHPLWNLTDVPAALLRGLRFTPSVHVNYQET